MQRACGSSVNQTAKVAMNGARTAVSVSTNKRGPQVVKGLTGVISGHSCKDAIRRKYKLSGRRNWSAKDLGTVVTAISQKEEPYMEFTIWLSGKSEVDSLGDGCEWVGETGNWTRMSLRALASELHARTREGSRTASVAQPIKQRPNERKYWPPVTGSLR